jgi:hypothetical protein
MRAVNVDFRRSREADPALGADECCADRPLQAKGDGIRVTRTRRGTRKDPR